MDVKKYLPFLFELREKKIYFIDIKRNIQELKYMTSFRLPRETSTVTLIRDFSASIKLIVVYH